ncbi:hypothetical protein DDE83_001400 [Stemphylium lycopersici]|uniref:Uncharacterized protein n=1 Tax=Stemphylium lycopersici TaxID=183478 RepID=A0A364NDF1_STELY|nr:hypothetical protein DDE83_001400 [Stemphylium lycopersici]
MAGSNTWNPPMTYRPGHDRPLGATPNLLEQYADESVITYWRAFKGKLPNHNHDAEIQTAVNISNAIDLLDNNPDLMDQVIWGATHPDDCHPGVRTIAENAPLVDLLLIRQFKKHGGIVLPPLAAARKMQDNHEIVAGQEKAQGNTWLAGNRSMVKYPNWREWKAAQPPPGFAAADAPLGAGRGAAARGRGGYRGRGGCGGGY